MNSRAPKTIGAAFVLLTVCQGFAAFAQGETVPTAAPAKSQTGSENIPDKNEAGPAKVDPVPTKLSCRAVRNDIGMYEPLRFMSITIDIPKKYVKTVHEGDGRIIEYTDGGPAASYKSFVKITDDSVVYGQQGRETWKIDRYTGTMTSSAFTIQFECQLRPSERKF